MLAAQPIAIPGPAVPDTSIPPSVVRAEVLELLPRVAGSTDAETGVLELLDANPELLHDVSLFHAAVAHGVSSSVLYRWLGPRGAGALVNTPGAHGDTALHVAARHRRWELVPELVKYGADCQILNDLKRTPMIEAFETLKTMERGEFASLPTEVFTILYLLEDENRSPESSCTDTMMKTLLDVHPDMKTNLDMFHVAIEEGASLEVLKLFLSEDSIQINAQGITGNTALHLAVKNKRWELIPELIKHGSDRNALNRQLNTPLMELLDNNNAQTGIPISAMTQLMTGKGMRTSAQNNLVLSFMDLYPDLKQDVELFHRAIKHDAIPEIIECFLGDKNTMNAEGKDGNTALQVAVKHKKWDVVERLLKHGCDLNIFTGQKQTALNEILSLSSKDEVPPKILTKLALEKNKKFIEQNILIRVPTKDRHAALTNIKEQPNHEVNNNVLDDGSRANKKLERKLDSQMSNLNKDSSTYQKMKAPEDIPRTSSEKSMEEISNINSDSSTSQKRVAPENSELTTSEESLHITEGKSHSVSEADNIARMLFNLNPKIKENVTLFHTAIKHNSPRDIIDLFLSKESLINAPDNDGNTALHIALQTKNWQIVPELIQHGSNQNAVNRFQRTPLHELLIDVKLASEVPMAVVKNLITPKHLNNYHKLYTADMLFELFPQLIHSTHLFHFTIRYGAPMRIIVLFFNAKEFKSMIRAHGKDGNTALHIAAKVQRWQVMRELLQHGADCNAMNDVGRTPLEEAFKNTNAVAQVPIDILQQFITADFITNMSKKESIYQLAVALFAQNPQLANDIHLCHRLIQNNAPYEILSKFISCKKIINAQGKDGNTALHVAVKYRKWLIVKELLHNGSDCNALNDFKRAPLQEAMLDLEDAADIPFDVLKELITEKHIKSLREDDELYEIAMMLFYLHPLLKADVDLFHMAIVHNAPSGILAQFLSHQEMVNACGKLDETALHVAVKCRNWNLVEELVILGANCNALNSDSRAPLQEVLADRASASKVPIGVIKKLITAEHIKKTSKDDGILQLAMQMFEMYPQLWNDVDIFHCAIQHDASLKIVSRYVADKNLINVIGEDGNTSLHIAVKYKRWQLVQNLINNGADCNALNDLGRTALQEALVDIKVAPEIPFAVIKQLMLEHVKKTSENKHLYHLTLNLFGYHPQLKNDIDIFHASIAHNAPSGILEQFYSQQSMLNDGGKLGNTSLHIAMQYGRWDLIPDLLEHGADANIRNDFDQCPVQAIFFDAAGVCEIPLNVIKLLLTEEYMERAAEDEIIRDQMMMLIECQPQLTKDVQLFHTLIGLNAPTIIIDQFLTDKTIINAKGEDDDTALHIAIKHHRHQLVPKLVESGSDCNALNKKGSLPIQYLDIDGLDTDLSTDLVQLLVGENMNKSLDENKGIYAEAVTYFKTHPNLKKDVHLFHEAIEENLPSNILHQFIHDGFVINKAGPNGNRGLHLAIKMRNWQLVSELLRHGADCNVLNDCNKTPLQEAWADVEYAAEAEEIPMDAKELLSELIGRTSKVENFKLVMLLFEIYPSLNEDVHLFHFAIKRNAHPGIIDHFISENEKLVNARGIQGNTALHVAVQHKQWALMEELIEQGADRSAFNDSDRSPLHEVVSHFDLISEVPVKVIKQLLTEEHMRQASHDPDMADIIKLLFDVYPELLEDIETVHTSIKYGLSHPLMFHKAFINRSGKCGNTSLHIAVLNRKWKLVSKLIKKGADRNALNDFERAPLQEAGLDLEKLPEVPTRIIKQLITPEHIKSTGEDIENRKLAMLLFETHPKLKQDVDLFRDAIEYGSHPDIIKAFLSEDKFINACDARGNTPLHMAVHHKMWPLALELTQRGADRNALNNEKQTPLHEALNKPSCSVPVDVLQELITDEHIKNTLQDSDIYKLAMMLLTHYPELRKTVDLLHTVIQHNVRSEILDQFLCDGSMINAAGEDGNTALHVAVKYRRWNLVPKLVHHGSDRNALNDFHRSPLLEAFVDDDVASEIPAWVVEMLISPENVNSTCFPYAYTSQPENVKYSYSPNASTEKQRRTRKSSLSHERTRRNVYACDNLYRSKSIDGLHQGNMRTSTERLVDEPTPLTTKTKIQVLKKLQHSCPNLCCVLL